MKLAAKLLPSLFSHQKNLYQLDLVFRSWVSSVPNYGSVSFLHIHIGDVQSPTRTDNKLELPGQKIRTELLDSGRHSAGRQWDDEFVDDWHKHKTHA
jgi:hypothetical protein